MTTTELYSAYISKKSQVETISTQIQNLNSQLYIAEQELASLAVLVREAGDQALLNTLFD